MRRVSFLLLFIVLGSLLAAAPVRAEGTGYYALSFDGVDDYVNVGNNLNLPNPLTIVALIKVDDTDGEKVIVAKDAFGYNAGDLSLKIVDSSVQLVASDGSRNYVASYSKIIEASKTHLIAGVADTSEMRVYVDGVLGGTCPYVASMDNTNTNLMIGVRGGDVGYFKGKIYLVLIYNRALSDSEIQQIYNDPLNPPTDGLVLWLAPDSVDTANVIWTDKSGNGNDGTIYGATPERVSIPSLSVYDEKSLQPIPLTSVKVTLLSTEPEPLLPGLIVLPPNETVTLSISATKYYPKVITTSTNVSAISVFLKPFPTAQEQVEQFNISSGTEEALGGGVIAGLVILVILLIAAIKHGIGAGAIMVAMLPAVLAMGFYGYLPLPIAFIALAIAGFLTYYVIREWIGGGYK